MKFSSEKISDVRVYIESINEGVYSTGCTASVSFILSFNVTPEDIRYFLDPEINPQFNMCINGLKIDVTEVIKKIEQSHIA